MRIDITPGSAFGLLQAIDSRHPSALVTEAGDGEAIRLKLWIDGVESAHTVCLNQNGTWAMSTEVEP